jgi:23S rRNA pseudouridine1911/1915/1917 synthase
MNKIVLNAEIDASLSGLRLDQALAKLFSEYSRAQLQSFIKAGHVKVDKRKAARSRDIVQVGQVVEIEAELEDRYNWAAQEIPLDIIFADEHLIIVNKPAGLIVHPGAGAPDHTLVNALVHHFPELANLPRAGIIHRLDKNTTGLLVIARNLTAHNALTQAMQERQIERTYETIVHGVMTAGGTINADMARHPTQRTKMSVVRSGRTAITHYRVIERFTKHTHVQVKLETGRTHQIRVHLAHIRYPVVGDSAYGRNKTTSSKLPENLQLALKNFDRQALHAKALSLIHPATGEELHFEAPLPLDMANLISLLKQSN